MQETLKHPYAWSTEEFNVNGELVWSSITQFRPKELSWIRDLPNKKHYITITPLYKDEASSRRTILNSTKQTYHKM